ncbi:MAG: PEP-CTERM sorting domain-containing protein [Phycisphaerae bacterium]
MLKKFLASGLVLCAASVAVAQSTSLLAITADPTAGPDAATFTRGVAGVNSPATSHWTYDVRVSTLAADWTGSELTLDVVGAGSIWHASDQRISTGSPASDPNEICYNHNLNSPGLTGGATTSNSRSMDTFFTAPGTRFSVDPSFASPGVPAADPLLDCPANPPIISTATRLRGLNPSGVEIPLAWFDAATAATGAGATLARLTFEVPGDFGNLQVVNAGAPAPVDTQLFAVIRGRSTTNLNSDGVGFGFDIYQVPEPSTMALLALGGLAGLIRRR